MVYYSVISDVEYCMTVDSDGSSTDEQLALCCLVVLLYCLFHPQVSTRFTLHNITSLGSTWGLYIVYTCLRGKRLVTLGYVTTHAFAL